MALRVKPVSSVVRVLPDPTIVMFPAPRVLMLPAVGDMAPPELPVNVCTTLVPPLTAMVMELDPLVMLIPVPGVKVVAKGAVVPDPIIKKPFVVKGVNVGTPVRLVVNTAALVGPSWVNVVVPAPT